MANEEKPLTKSEAMRILRRMQGKTSANMTKRELELALRATGTLLKLNRPFTETIIKF